MSNKAGPTRDAFTFSLGGLTTIASFVPAPVVADTRIRQVSNDRNGHRRNEADPAKERHDTGCASAA
jgi:hypothetical protein